MRTWLLLTYSVPRSPTSSRVYVWRKMKELGALSIQDAVWLLPMNDRTAEQFQWLQSEIGELGGSSTLFQGSLLSKKSDEEAAERFRAAIEKEYKELLTKLSKSRPNRALIARQYQRTRSRDYFRCKLRADVEARLTKGEKV